MYKVVLFRTDKCSFFSIGEPDHSIKNSHAALLSSGGTVVDASERRGFVGFSESLREYGHREIDVFLIKSSAEADMYVHKALHSSSLRYDYFGVFARMFDKQMPCRVTCVEFVLEYLSRCGLCDVLEGRSNFDDVTKLLGKPAYSGAACHYS